MVLRGRVIDCMIQVAKESIIAGMSCSINQAAGSRGSKVSQKEAVSGVWNWTFEMVRTSRTSGAKIKPGEEST